TPSGKMLLTASVDQTIRTWENPTGRELKKLKAKAPAHEATGYLATSFSCDGQRAAWTAWSQTIYLYDLATQKSASELVGHTSAIDATVFSPDGAWLVSGSPEETAFYLWDVAKAKRLCILQTASRANRDENPAPSRLAFAPDAKWLAGAGGYTNT